MSSGFPREAAVVLENGLRTRADDSDLARPTHESSDSTSHGRRPNLPYLIRFTSLVDACGRRGPSPMMPLLDPYWDRCHVLVRLVPGALLPDLEPPPGRCPRSWPGRATEATPARSCQRGPRGSTLQSPDRGSLRRLDPSVHPLPRQAASSGHGLIGADSLALDRPSSGPTLSYADSSELRWLISPR